MNQKPILPTGWKWAKLNELCEKISLNKIKIKQKQYLTEGRYPVVDQGQDLIGGYYDDTNLVIPGEPPFIVFGDHTKVKKFVSFKFIAGADGVKVLKAKEVIDPKYLYYSLFTIKIEDKGYARHFQLLEKELFPLPPKEIQKSIVSKIEELFSELDKGIENLRLAQQQLKTYRQAVLKWAFEGRLTNENVKDGELPEGWKLLKLKDITLDKEGLRRGPFGSAIKKEYFVMNGYKVYEQGNAINDDPYRGHYYVSEEKYNELKNFKVSPHDLIVSCSGVTLGRICELPNDMQPGIINQALLRIRLKRDKILTRYFVIYFRSAFFQKKIFDQSQGTAMPNLIGIKDFKEIEMLVPTIEKQNKIVQEIENRHRVADKLEERITQSLQQAEALRQSILKKAFEGRLIS